MNEGRVCKCPVCGRAYRTYMFMAGDQSACPACRREADEAESRPDTSEQINRRFKRFR